jgi:hypothetical protein
VVASKEVVQPHARSANTDKTRGAADRVTDAS